MGDGDHNLTNLQQLTLLIFIQERSWLPSVYAIYI